VCQSIFRRALGIKQLHLLKAKKREEFAKLIQAEWESRIAKRRFNRILLSMRTKKHLEGSAAVVIQAIWRGYFTQHYFSTLAHHATTIQTFARKFIASRKYIRIVSGELCVLPSIDLSHVMSWTHTLICAADVTKCQCAVRRYHAIKFCAAMNYKKKTCLARSKLAKLKCCSMILQMIQYRHGAISIQRVVRGWVMKKRYEENVKGKKSQYKKLFSLIPITDQVTDIVTCQYAVMVFLARKKLIELRNRAATIILLQARVRKNIAAKCFAFSRRNAAVIQSVIRMRPIRKQFLATRLGESLRLIIMSK
jgi:hypothetical protein